MLNKLLKRYMPWMDKGRWYRCNIKISGYSDPVFMLPSGWNGVKVQGSSHWYITTNIKRSFVLNTAVRMYGEYEDGPYGPGAPELLNIQYDNNGYLVFDIDYDIGVRGGSDIKCVFDVFIEVI